MTRTPITPLSEAAATFLSNIHILLAFHTYVLNHSRRFYGERFKTASQSSPKVPISPPKARSTSSFKLRAKQTSGNNLFKYPRGPFLVGFLFLFVVLVGFCSAVWGGAEQARIPRGRAVSPTPCAAHPRPERGRPAAP